MQRLGLATGRARRAIVASGVASGVAFGVLAGVVLTACKGGQRESRTHDSAPSAPSAPADAAVADASLEACRAVAARAPTMRAAERATALLEACRPCGDWEPLLAWNTPEGDGGPPRAAIERAMVACNAYCEPGAKQRFLGTLDAARGQPTRTPWRLLGEICREAVSAVPDARFMGAPYFALDRIARAIADPAVLAAIEIPLPAVTITGIGVDLPPAPAAPPAVDASPAALTIDAAQILLGTLPVARLSPTGLAIAGDYPGAAVEPRALPAALARAAPDGRPVTVLAPLRLPAARVADVVASAGGHELRLAVAGPGRSDFRAPVVLPIALVAGAAARGIRIVLSAASVDPAIEAARAAAAADLARGPAAITLEPGVEVDALAKLLAALAARDVRSATLVRSPTKSAPSRPPHAKP